MTKNQSAIAFIVSAMPSLEFVFDNTLPALTDENPLDVVVPFPPKEVVVVRSQNRHRYGNIDDDISVLTENPIATMSVAAVPEDTYPTKCETHHHVSGLSPSVLLAMCVGTEFEVDTCNDKEYLPSRPIS